jgi:hypothetical protein
LPVGIAPADEDAMRGIGIPQITPPRPQLYFPFAALSGDKPQSLSR